MFIKQRGNQARCEFCDTVIIWEGKEQVKKHIFLGGIKFTPIKAAAVAAVFLALVFVVVILSVYLTDKPPAPNTDTPYQDPLAFKYAGTYLAGKDIPAGTYLISADPAKSYGQVYIATTQTASPSTSNCTFQAAVQFRRYVTVEDGLFLTVKDANLFLPGAKKPGTESDGGYAGGMQYKVGTDISAGEYALHSADNSYISYSITDFANSDSFDGKRQTSYKGRLYVLLAEGEYIYLSGAKLYPPESRPAVRKNGDGSYPCQQYKIGIDIAEGNYIVGSADERKYHYYFILCGTTDFSFVWDGSYRPAIWAGDTLEIACDGCGNDYFVLSDGSLRPA